MIHLGILGCMIVLCLHPPAMTVAYHSVTVIYGYDELLEVPASICFWKASLPDN